MVDRIFEYLMEVPFVQDDLRTNRNYMIGLGKLAEALIGKQTVIQGLFCKPTIPASLEVLVESGQIFSWENVDDSAYSELPADTDNQIVKQGIVLGETTLECDAPATPGFSINHLVQIKFQEVDDTIEERPFYNAADPSQPLYDDVATQRSAKCIVEVKAGTAAATGTQVTPTPDAGFVGAWVVTVDEGQTEITALDIVEYPDAPFIKQTSSLFTSKVVNDGSNNYSGTSQPPIAVYEFGLTAIIQVDTPNTGDSTLDLGAGAVQMIDMDGQALSSHELVGGFPYVVTYNNGKWVVYVKSSTIERLPPGYRSGVLLSNNVTDPLHDIDFAPGSWRDKDDTVNLVLPSTFVKKIDAPFAEGTNAGGFPDGLTLTIDTKYHCFLLGKPDGTTDCGYDSDINASNLLVDVVVVAAGYTKIRRVHTAKTNGSLNILPFHMYYEGKTRVTYWDTPVVSYSSLAPGIAAFPITLDTPLDVNTTAIIHAYIQSPTTALAAYVYFSNPAVIDLVPTPARAQAVAGTQYDDSTQILLMTNTASQIRSRLTASDGNTELVVGTIGWKE